VKSDNIKNKLYINNITDRKYRIGWWEHVEEMGGNHISKKDNGVYCLKYSPSFKRVFFKTTEF
jgi:hypothetical protein